jgi:hypothetical protein
MKCTVRLLTTAWPVVLDFVLPSAYDAVLRVSKLSDTLLRNSRGADISHSLGEAQTSMYPLAAVEDHTRRRRAALLQLGVRPQLAANTAGSGRGPWYLARAKALSVGLSNAYFRSLGLPSLFENY